MVVGALVVCVVVWSVDVVIVVVVGAGAGGLVGQIKQIYNRFRRI